MFLMHVMFGLADWPRHVTILLPLCLQDLSGGNVMLTSCSFNPHGFQAKVGDFGLSREASASGRLAGNLYGTITHMAPEVMLAAQMGPVSSNITCIVIISY